MSAGPDFFRVVRHVVPSQHIREYPRATSTIQEEILYLAVNQYIPNDNPSPKRGDVTIIAAHANAFPKELYEPLWEEIYLRLKGKGFRIRGIWIADVAHQGQSGLLNENVLGNDPSWFDHPRDLLHLINLKREEMPRPIIGVGHSFGATHLTTLALMHPRLIYSLVLCDPVIYTPPRDAEPIAADLNTRLSFYRRDKWPSRNAAVESFMKNPFYQGWDRRTFDRWVKYGLRELPTAIYPQDQEATKYGDRPVTLMTTRYQEAFTFSRPNPNYDLEETRPVDTSLRPDMDPEIENDYPFYRPEPRRIFSQLPFLRASVLYVFGGKSVISTPGMCQAKLDNTGTGIGGSGGVAAGRVRSITLQDAGHLLPFEVVNECADAVASFLNTELERWLLEEEAFQARWSRKTKVEKMIADEWWTKVVERPPRKNRTKSSRDKDMQKAKL